MEKRIHKCRAWHTTKHCWIENFMDTSLLASLDLVLNHMKDVEIVWWTGITDLDGKEIYEGDIVFYDAYNTVGVVTWVATYPGYTILNPQKSGAFVLHEDWEVIGNIYEHGDLLKNQEKDTTSS